MTLGKSPFILVPDSIFRQTQNLISSILIIKWSLFQPFMLAFQPQLSETMKEILNYFDIISQIWFAIDLICQFNTGYYDKGIMVLNRKKIFIHYLKDNFVFDFLAIIPYEMIISIAIVNEFDNIIQNENQEIYQWIKYIQLVRILRFHRLKILSNYVRIFHAY